MFYKQTVWINLFYWNDFTNWSEIIEYDLCLHPEYLVAVSHRVNHFSKLAPLLQVLLWILIFGSITSLWTTMSVGLSVCQSVSISIKSPNYSHVIMLNVVFFYFFLKPPHFKQTRNKFGRKRKGGGGVRSICFNYIRGRYFSIKLYFENLHLHLHPSFHLCF